MKQCNEYISKRLHLYVVLLVDFWSSPLFIPLVRVWMMVSIWLVWYARIDCGLGLDNSEKLQLGEILINTILENPSKLNVLPKKCTYQES